MLPLSDTAASRAWPGLDLLTPDWPAPPGVRAFQTTRHGGVSQAPFHSLNLGAHVDDDPQAVAANRARVAALLPGEPLWLAQVHGATVAEAGRDAPGTEADGVVARTRGAVAVIMTADCLPVLFCDTAGTVVAAAHAGWRGLAAGVLENTLRAMAVPPEAVLAWLGPAIGPRAFEVGAEVRSAFVAWDDRAAAAFIPSPGEGGLPRAGKWRADLYALARLRLEAAGVARGRVHGGDWCTHAHADRFFSYRREPRTGRMGSFIWLD